MSLYFFRYSPLLFIQLRSAPLAILVGLLAVNFGARTLGYTAIGFGSFSVLFTFTLSACFVSVLKTPSHTWCSFMIQHNMTASTTMFRCNFLKHWIIFFISMLNKYFFKSIHVWCICPILFRTCI